MAGDSRQTYSSIYTMFTFLLLSALVLPTRALYFYMDGNTQKCFFEELPKDTLVVGQCPLPLPLHANSDQHPSHQAITTRNNGTRQPAVIKLTPTLASLSQSKKSSTTTTAS